MDLDVAVLGGGIAGLWTLARLHRAGYRVALFERRALGGVQSIASQGIIHGGTKYALTGRLTGSAQAIGDMPGIWRAALDGSGEIDLRRVRVLAAHQHLWSSGSLASGMAGFFAGKVMRSRMRSLDRADFPPPFDAPGFHGSVYRLDEPVLDPLSLVEAIAAPLIAHCFLVPDLDRGERAGTAWQLSWADGTGVRARAVVLAAGQGNAALLGTLGLPGPAMQLRPLHMLMLRGDLPELHAHCLGAGATPRLTVTSYPWDGGRVWYLGGQIAEQGVGRSVAAQIAAGRRELAELLPWLDLGAAEWAALTIDRAEPAMPGGRRPDDAYVDTQANVVTCWPTKLAFAPRVASLVMRRLDGIGLRPAPTGAVAGLPPGPRPPFARLPWDQVAAWS